MKNRETTSLEGLLMLALSALGVALVLCMTGCTSARGNMYVGQLTDLGTTYYGLEVDGDYSEANPSANDMVGVLLMKVTAIGVIELGAYMFPDHADVLYWIGAGCGYCGGAYNTTLLMDTTN